MPPSFRPKGQSRQVTNRAADLRRGTAHSRGYDARWAKASKAYLASHPLCEYCAAGAFGDDPRDEPASLVDHLFPHRADGQSDRALFWCDAGWVASCTPCHSGPKQAVERRGLVALRQLAELLGRPILR